MSQSDTFDTNPGYAALKQNLVERGHNLMIKGLLYAGGSALAGAVIGGALGGIGPTAFSDPSPNLLATTAMSGAMMGGMVGFMGGGLVSAVLMNKETAQLKLDEQSLQARVWRGDYGDETRAGWADRIGPAAVRALSETGAPVR